MRKQFVLRLNGIKLTRPGARMLKFSTSKNMKELKIPQAAAAAAGAAGAESNQEDVFQGPISTAAHI